MTPEQKDLETRAAEFNAEMIPLLKKYKVGLGAVPFILPNGTIGARPQLFDDSKTPEDKPLAQA